MKTRYKIILFFCSIAVSVLTAFLETAPGYMDAEYYYATGIQIASGKGFNEPFIWNYLDNPAGIPHPSHTYWMPLTSILAALGMMLFHSTGFWAARLLFIIGAACVPLISAQLTFLWTGREKAALVAGFLAVFPGFYLIYTTIPSTILAYLILGGGVILSLEYLLREQEKNNGRQWIILGLLTGLMHLTRADGIIWLAGCVCIPVARAVFGKPKAEKLSLRKRVLIPVLMIGLGYLAILLAWYGRNLALTGSVFPVGNSKALWLTRYDELFSYPASGISFNRWAAQSLASHWQNIWEALVMNLKNIVAVQGEIFLIPFILSGMYKLRKRPSVIFAAAMWVATLLLMTVVFPFAGSRGGLIHASAAFQCVFWAAAPLGLESFISLGVKYRKWKFERAFSGMGVLFCFITGIFTLAMTYQIVIGTDSQKPAWAESQRIYIQVAAYLNKENIDRQTRVLVNNPPGFYLASGRPALVIPDGDEKTIFEVAKNYDAEVLLLDRNYSLGLKSIYENPSGQKDLIYLETIEGVEIFRFVNPEK